MVGTVAPVTTASISRALPRGITTSTKPRAVMRSCTESWLSHGSNCTASRGRSWSARTSWSTATSAALEWRAVLEPRNSAALPDLSASPNASTVTFGRAS